MTKKCVICDAEFEDEKLLKKHVNEHLSESVLNKPIEESADIDSSFEDKNPQLDIKKIFLEEKFEKLIKSKINTITDVQEIIKKRRFVEQIKKISRKNPFCYPSYFLEDYVSGTSKTKLQEKYHIWFWMDLQQISHKILKFTEDRFSSKNYDNAKELNFKIDGWKEKYEEFQENCEFFLDEINSLFFDNVLQAGILFLLMDNDFNKKEISIQSKELKNHYDLFHFLNDGSHRSEKLINIFNKFLETDLEDRIEGILSSLKQENIVKRSRKDARKYKVNFSIDEIKTGIINELKISKTSPYSLLRTSITARFPALRLIPKFGIFEASWKELEKEGRIFIEYQSSRKDDFIVFLNETHQKLDIDIESIERKQSKIPFMGRKITPERFVHELKSLDKGDFDDADDQVTRLAGLVFAEAVRIQAPHEKIEEFDFTIDIKNYDFRPEQIEAIDTLDFQINAEIMHVKVMIDEVLTLEKYEELKKKVPPNEQGVVVTFQEVVYDVKEALQNDKTIQTIDEEGVKIWVSITPRIPARVNSISKITFDPLSKLEKKIVRVNSVLYEKGVALVSVFPEMNEETVLARTLEEVELLEATPQKFNEYSEHYLEFLEIIYEISNESEQFEAFFNNQINDVDISSGKIRSSIEFENASVVIELDEYEEVRKCMNCTCFKWSEDKSELCKHIITALDYLVRNSEFLDDLWDKSYNKIQRLFNLFFEENIKRDLDNIIYEIEDDKKEMILDYVSKIIKS